MSPISWEPLEELPQRLIGAEGPAIKSALLEHLRILEARLNAQLAQGGTPEAYADMQAALLAVRSGADTLLRIDLPEFASGSSPLVDPRPFLPGDAP